MKPFLLAAAFLAACQSAPDGGGAGAGALLLTGVADSNGVDAPFRLWLAPDGGALRIEGPLGQELVCAGGRAWLRNWSNPPRELQLAERETALLQFALLSGAWDDADGPVERLDGPGGPQLRLRGGRARFDLALDPATGEPARLTRAEEGAVEGIALEDWSTRGGVRAPARIRRGSLDAMHDVFEVRTRARVPAPALAAPAPPPRDWAFDPGAPAALEAKRAKTGHVLVRPLLDGEDRGWFIFDSGAGAMCLDSAVAEAIGAERIGGVTAVGVAGRTDAGILRARSFTLGPLTLRDPVFVELDLAFVGAALGETIAGIAGYEVFARSVVEFEAGAALHLALHDPARYALPEGAVWQELLLDGNLPCARARFEGGREGLFRLDTGADGLAFHAGAVAKWDLLAGRETGAGTAGGVGGAQAVRVGRLDWFELGGERYEDVQAAFYTGTAGAFADADLDGNLGLDLLGRFRLVFDYGNSRMSFARPGQASSAR